MMHEKSVMMQLNQGDALTFSTHRSKLNDALVMAAQSGNIQRVTQLLNAGANVDYWPKDDNSDPAGVCMEELIFQSYAIFAACTQGHFQVVLTLFTSSNRKHLLTEYWPVLLQTLRNKWSFQRPHNVVNTFGQMVILSGGHCVHHMLFMKDSNIRFLRYLINAGADVNARCRCGMTPLANALSSSQYSSEVLQTLLEAGADPNLLSQNNLSPLAMAAKNGHITAMESLLLCGSAQSLHYESPANIQIYHPLVFSVIRGDMVQVQLLLNYNSQPITMLQYLVHAHHNFPFDIEDLTFFNKYISLLYLALYLNKSDVAQLFIKLNFLSKSDINELPKDFYLHKKLQYSKEQVECATLFESISSKPWSLFTLSFVSVSEAVGFGTSRPEKLQKLGLPNKLVNTFLYLPL